MLVLQDVGLAGVLRARITEAGYRPIWACDVADALAAITHERPAVVVVEVGEACAAGRDVLAKLDRALALARIPRLLIKQHGPYRLAGDRRRARSHPGLTEEPFGEDGRELSEITQLVREVLVPFVCAPLRSRRSAAGRSPLAHPALHHVVPRDLDGNARQLSKVGAFPR